MKYTLKTTYPCVIKSQNEFVELEENDTLEIENEKIVYVYPQNHSHIPFCINLAEKKDSTFFSFFTLKNENFVILERQNEVFCLKKESLNFGGKTVKIAIGRDEIVFESDSKIIKIENGMQKNGYKVAKVGNFACLWFDKNFYAYSMKKEKLFHFGGDEIVFENGELTVCKQTHSDQKKITVKFDEDLKIETQSIENQEKIIEELVPFKFLQQIKEQKFESALNFLNENVKAKTDSQKLQSFFGKITDILPLDKKAFIVMCERQKKYVTFDLSNEKISDISIDDL